MANISKIVGATSAKCSGRNDSLAIPRNWQNTFSALAYLYWDRGSAEIAKFSENFRIVAWFLRPCTTTDKVQSWTVDF